MVLGIESVESMIIGLGIGILITLVFTLILKRVRRKNVRTAFVTLRNQIKQGHDGLVKASEAMRTLDELLNSLERNMEKPKQI